MILARILHVCFVNPHTGGGWNCAEQLFHFGPGDVLARRAVGVDEEGDVREVAATGERFDRAIFDLPEPWEILGALDDAIGPGGIVCGYLPTTVQVQQLGLALEEHGFEHLETFEVLHRPWHVTRRSVRPDHRMVAHTGFLTVGRRLAADPMPSAPRTGDV